MRVQRFIVVGIGRLSVRVWFVFGNLIRIIALSEVFYVFVDFILMFQNLSI